MMQRLMLVLAVGVWLTGCEADAPCDKDQVHTQGACAPKSSNSEKDAATAETDAATESDSGGGGGVCSENLRETLGKACTDDDGCNCSAPYCAKMPGQAMGTCTVFCKTMPNDCPDGCRCFDLSAVGVSGYEPFCIKK
jgi:hypothetical protein